MRGLLWSKTASMTPRSSGFHWPTLRHRKKGENLRSVSQVWAKRSNGFLWITWDVCLKVNWQNIIFTSLKIEFLSSIQIQYFGLISKMPTRSNLSKSMKNLWNKERKSSKWDCNRFKGNSITPSEEMRTIVNLIYSNMLLPNRTFGLLSQPNDLLIKRKQIPKNPNLFLKVIIGPNLGGTKKKASRSTSIKVPT
jgi:hypothetical protein